MAAGYRSETAVRFYYGIKVVLCDRVAGGRAAFFAT